MVFAFFDDSNIHDPVTGHVTVTGLGGAFVTYAQSLILQREWRAVVDSENVQTFHMTDFESYKGQFSRERGWTTERHQNFLMRLLDVIKRNVQSYEGFSFEMLHESTNHIKAYTRACGQVFLSCWENARREGEKLSIVLAKHNDVRARRLDDLVRDLAFAMPEITEVVESTPEASEALQAADLLAFELIRWRNAPELAGARFPIRYLSMNASQPFRVSHQLFYG